MGLALLDPPFISRFLLYVHSMCIRLRVITIIDAHPSTIIDGRLNYWTVPVASSLLRLGLWPCTVPAAAVDVGRLEAVTKPRIQGTSQPGRQHRSIATWCNGIFVAAAQSSRGLP